MWVWIGDFTQPLEFVLRFSVIVATEKRPANTVHEIQPCVRQIEGQWSLSILSNRDPFLSFVYETLEKNNVIHYVAYTIYIDPKTNLTFWLRSHCPFKLAKAWWKEPDTGVPAGARDSCSAARMWRAACSVLVCPDADEAWTRLSAVAPPDTVWHSLRNCVAYQAGVWHNLLQKGVDDVIQPAAFKLAIVLRHTPTDLVVRLLADLLRLHPQSQDLTSYVLALLTDDEAAWCGACGAGTPPAPGAPPGPAPLRDLQLFGDCELAILAASREEYEAHAKLVRAEYAALTNRNYVELRIKVLNQFSQIPKLYHTPEFECFEPLARENIEREICTLREHLLTGQHE